MQGGVRGNGGEGEGEEALENGSGGRARTYNLGVNSALLYH